MSIGLSSRARDAGLVLGVGVVVVAGTAVQPGAAGLSSVWSWVLVVGACAALAVRRRYPVTVAATTLLSCVLAYGVVGADGPILLTFVVALYAVAARGRTVVAAALLLLALGAVVLGETASPQRHIDDPGLLMLTGWLVASIGLGRARHTQLAYAREAEQRAATEERLRIARELHDALGHNLSLINVQAAAALHRLDQNPEQAGTALGAIKQASKESLRELRSTLGVLREVDAQLPGLAHLDTLVEQARAGGLAVVTEVAGERRELAPETDLTAYRLVQEALTNVRRHAGARRATVRIRYKPKELRVEVIDDGKGGQAEAGYGIAGMSERVRALGGDFTTHSQAGGGFRVSARLPQGVGA
ncbi:sensor histidine kinase [Saccharomonospora sp. NPDC046836]|uniref:sensor histidine kinase n=1 Tax=Saccharomonospora sp. NPDC046836 TaxID=3156921 RepID=UPI003401AFC1